jgi:RNA polymerase sigma-70 factor, ECF subfamily
MTERKDYESIEREIRFHCDAGEHEQAATFLLRKYGREILRFLLSRLDDEEASGEVFSQFTEDLWRGLAGFRWKCTARVWSYTLARHAASRYIADARRRRAREAPLSRAGPLSAIEAKIRTQTLAAARSEIKGRVAELRARLPLDDQTLLILRVNRGLGWKEIAQVMTDAPDGSRAPSAAVIDREAARFRQRYQTIKQKLRAMASEAGLAAQEDAGEER